MGKWTEETKNVAIKMIKEGFKCKEIAKIVNMSIASVDHVKYNDVFGYSEKIKCEICKKDFRQITQKHLINYHNIFRMTY